eukprot:6194545-Pleurochrysis_carterae.AAC.9
MGAHIASTSDQDLPLDTAVNAKRRKAMYPIYLSIITSGSATTLKLSEASGRQRGLVHKSGRRRPRTES